MKSSLQAQSLWFRPERKLDFKGAEMQAARILKKSSLHFFCPMLFFSLISCQTVKLTPSGNVLPVQVAEEIPVEQDAVEEQVPEIFQDGSKIVTSETAFEEKDTILLTFAGDLMAHPALWQNGEFERIYEEISGYVKESAFSFVNLETPLCDTRPYSGYPGFNIHHEYADAAIDAGFNVFSLTNNHTNDQGLTGINSTRAYFEKKAYESKDSDRRIYHAGLKEKKNGPLTYQVLEKDGWTILFVAVTEILNSQNSSSMIDYVPPSVSARNDFVSKIKKLRSENPCDLFVISIHCSEPEYIFDLSSRQKAWYERLLENGADIIWVNHPHVAKDWELFPDAQNVPRKIVFYSMGNFISKHETRRNTGEGFMTQIRFEKTEDNGIVIDEINPVLLTTYRTKDNHYVIRKLDDDFIKRLETEDPAQADFFRERKTFMKKISGKVQWQ